MTIMDWLRKLGILRYGVKTGTYTSGKDRPIEFMMDGVINAEKDLTTKADLKAMSGKPPPVPPALPAPSPVCGKCGAALAPGGKFCAACGTPVAPPSRPLCAGCKAPLKEGARFCSSCGQAVSAPVTAAAAPVPPMPAGRRKVLPLVLLLAGGTGFLILVIVVAALQAGKGRSWSSGSEGEEVLTRTVAEAGISPAPQPKPAVARPMAEPAPVTQAAPQARAPAMKYDIYRNPKFGFLTELPAHWESSVKDNTHLFHGAKGTEQYKTTINFQFVARANRSIRKPADEILGEWKALDDFDLEEITQDKIGERDILFMTAHYRVPSGERFRQKQVIIDRDPHFILIGYTAPEDVYPKYEFVMAHLLETFRFLP